MPPIEQAEFLQRFMTLLAAAGSPERAREAPGLAPPMAALVAAPRPYAEVYGPEGRLLSACATMALAGDDPGMAGLLSALDKALRDGTLDMQAPPDPAPRLSRYVYPVV